MSLLKLEHINTGYGKKQVLFDVNLEIQEGETVLLIGANGSGKSSLLKVAYRLLPIWEYDNCTLSFNGKDLTKNKVHELISMGFFYMPQKNELFDNLTVNQNLALSTFHRTKKSLSSKKLEEVLDLLPGLRPLLNQSTATLSGGERKMVSIAMLTINKPKLAMLDEPLSGLSNDQIPLIIEHLSSINKMGCSLLIVEHNVRDIFKIASRTNVMKCGNLLSDQITSLENAKNTLL